VDLYTTPTLYLRCVPRTENASRMPIGRILKKLYLRTPKSEQEEIYTYPDDDPFYTELSTLVDVIDKRGHDTDNLEHKILSSYVDACKTYEFTWRIRDESEKSSERFSRK
jgi:hypothetical protein